MPSDPSWIDWDKEDLRKATVIPQVDAVAVYRNTSNDVVIRQRNNMGEDDAFICVPVSSVPALIKALKEAAKG